MSRLARIGMVLFVIGLVAVAVILVLFATGMTELPLWLNLVAMLAPVGFGVGLLGVYVEARDARKVAAARRAGRSGTRPLDRVDTPTLGATAPGTTG